MVLKPETCCFHKASDLLIEPLGTDLLGYHILLVTNVSKLLKNLDKYKFA